MNWPSVAVLGSAKGGITEVTNPEMFFGPGQTAYAGITAPGYVSPVSNIFNLSVNVTGGESADELARKIADETTRRLALFASGMARAPQTAAP